MSEIEDMCINIVSVHLDYWEDTSQIGKNSMIMQKHTSLICHVAVKCIYLTSAGLLADLAISSY